MKKKERIQTLKKTNPAFSKGAVWTKCTVVLCLIALCAMQGFIVWYFNGVNETALIHMGIQSAVILLILSGRSLFIWGYLVSMLASLGMATMLNMEKQSIFYLVQMAYFAFSALMMLILLVSKNSRIYRKELKKARKPHKEETEKKEIQQESETSEPEPAVEEVEVIEETQEEIIEPVIETQEEEFVPVLQVKQNQWLQVSCPMNVDLTYGSFSRFLVQHYPFVYLHPRFDADASPYVQMCIASEGFDKMSDELYSGEFMLHQANQEDEKRIWLEYSDEMGRLCALICADWLVMQKGTLMQDGININAELMKQLTEAFVQAQDAKKKPFKGFMK